MVEWLFLAVPQGCLGLVIVVFPDNTHLLFLIIFSKMKKGNKQCLLDTPRTVRVSEKTWQVIVRTRRP